MECRQAKYLLSRSIENDLKPEEALELEEHLRSCRNCAKDLKLLRKLISMADVAEGREPARVAMEVRQRLDRKTWRQNAQEFLRRIQSLQLAAKIAVLGAGIFFAIYFLVVYWPDRKVVVEEPAETEPAEISGFVSEQAEDVPPPSEVPQERKGSSGKSPASKKKAAVKKEPEQPTTEDVLAFLDSRIAEAEDRQIIKKPFSDATKIASRMKKEKSGSVDARALREELLPMPANQKTEPAEKLVLVADSIKDSQRRIFEIMNDLKGEVIKAGSDNIILYVSSDRYPEFIERVEKEVGGFVRPAAGEYTEEVPRKPDMVPLNIQFIPTP